MAVITEDVGVVVEVNDEASTIGGMNPVVK